MFSLIVYAFCFCFEIAGNKKRKKKNERTAHETNASSIFTSSFMTQIFQVITIIYKLIRRCASFMIDILKIKHQ